MPKIETWGNLPGGVRQHLIGRMRDRWIAIADLNKLRIWIGSFKICGQGAYPETFLLRGQAAKGSSI